MLSFLAILPGMVLIVLSLLQPAIPSEATNDSYYRPRTQFATTPTVRPIEKLSVFVEPQAGVQPILNAINTARRSIWLETYLLTDSQIIQALENAAHRHLDVRVMLEAHPFGGGSPDATLAALKAAGAQVQTGNPAFNFTHAKIMLIDELATYIMTCNFTRSALHGGNREYGVISSLPQHVTALRTLFLADWNRSAVKMTDPDLLVSPINARSGFISFIKGARHTLLIEAEEMMDDGVEQALADAEQRGVQVQVILPVPRNAPDPNDPGIKLIKQAGAEVREDPQLIMHAKMMIADGTRGFVGSENISTNSLDNNREVGLIFTTKAMLTTLQQTFQQDWTISQAA
jgi:phosphatidylserine/phosphatidylglycerophosphate/cardiolipin synthase-like enzyme